MLRVGLTGELGSGKSTVARLLAGHGAIVLSSDEMGRAMMQPGEPVYQAIVQQFGAGVLLSDGQLNRPELARLAFDPKHPRVEELNAIIHPAVLAEQERLVAGIAHTQPHAIVVIESALIFTTKHTGAGPWQRRFDRVVVVTAPEAVKINRFVERAASGRPLLPAERNALEADGRARLAAQHIPASVLAGCLVIDNTGTPEQLARRTEEVFRLLRAEADHVEVRASRS